MKTKSKTKKHKLNIQGIYIQKNKLNKTQKKRIATRIFNTTQKDAENDLAKLEKIDCDNIQHVKPGSPSGLKFINQYTLVPRLETVGNKGIDFFDFLENKDKFKKKKYVADFIKFLSKKKNTTEINKWYTIFKLYFGYVGIFRPIVAMNVYCTFSPHSILDFTMGWGGRLVGACALNIPKYIGIDSNLNLRKPYHDMVKTLEKSSSTTIHLLFQDALTVDYSLLDYDMVFTSPPYYNIELYHGTIKKSKDEWDTEFYRPIFKKTYQYLKRGGHYCLNVPEEVYERVCLGILGKEHMRIPLSKSKRTNEEKYLEYIYVWKKK